MALEFQDPRNARQLARIALFPGAWNPPTVAHRAIAAAALDWADEVVWVLPRAFPHKNFHGADFTARCEMLRVVTEHEPGFSRAISQGGLYLEIAEEARAALGPGPEIALVCGRDAAERIARWDYGRPGVFDHMVDLFPLLVAGRAGDYMPAAHHAERIVRLTMPESFDDVSSTEVRRRMAAGVPWRHLVPEAIADTVAELYARP